MNLLRRILSTTRKPTPYKMNHLKINPNQNPNPIPQTLHFVSSFDSLIRPQFIELVIPLRRILHRRCLNTQSISPRGTPMEHARLLLLRHRGPCPCACLYPCRCHCPSLGPCRRRRSLSLTTQTRCSPVLPHPYHLLPLASKP